MIKACIKINILHVFYSSKFYFHISCILHNKCPCMLKHDFFFAVHDQWTICFSCDFVTESLQTCNMAEWKIIWNMYSNPSSINNQHTHIIKSKRITSWTEELIKLTGRSSMVSFEKFSVLFLTYLIKDSTKHSRTASHTGQH